jgi:hypothetical protein
MSAGVGEALRGTWALFRNETDAARWFDLSADGFWRSFAAIPLALPFAATMLLFDTGTGEPSALTLAVGLGAYVTSWLLFVLALVPLLRLIGLLPRYAVFVVYYNWGQVPIAAAPVPVVLLGATGLLPDGAVSSLLAGVFLISLLYLARLARQGLGAGAAHAIAVVLFETVLSWSLQTWFAKLIG